MISRARSNSLEVLEIMVVLMALAAVVLANEAPLGVRAC